MMSYLMNCFLENNLTIIGIIAGICTVLSFIPQVVRIYQLRNVKAISLPMYAIFSIGEIFWIFYGCMLNAPAIIYTNIMILILALVILMMKIVWH